MTLLLILVTILHVLVCLVLIGVVLLQSGKAADLAGAFGGMGSQTTFGPRAAATVFTKATTAAAGLFMVTSLSLAILATKSGGNAGTGSVLEKTNLPAPAAPAQPQQQSKPMVEIIDEKGQVKQRNEVEIPKDAPKDGSAVPVKIGKELPLNDKQPAKK